VFVVVVWGAVEVGCAVGFVGMEALGLVFMAEGGEAIVWRLW
jgi:hypothetical protein